MKYLNILLTIFLLTLSALIFTLFYYEIKIQGYKKIQEELREENAKLKVQTILYRQGDKTNYEL